MVRGCHAVYAYDGSELIVKDQLGVGAFNYGEIVQSGATDGTNLSCVIPASATMGAGGTAPAVQGIMGVCNEDLTTTGTVAAGTVESVKVIVNPNMIYRIECDNSAQITWTGANDTSITFADTGTGWANFGGGWAWSYNTGELDYVVSSTSAANVTTLTTVTGTGTSSTTGILAQGNGPKAIVMNIAPATSIDADVIDAVAAGANQAINVVIVNSYIATTTYGVEMLKPATMNQAIRLATSPDNGRLFQDVSLFPSMAYQGEWA